MRIIHQTGQSRIEIAEVETPSPGPGEVLIKSAVSALCGSEMSAYRKDGIPGGNLGHEAAGVVVKTGGGAGSRVRVGQRVGVSAIAGCGQCAECAAGRYTWCDAFTFHSHMHAEYFVVPERACHLLPDDISWETGVLITGDGFGVPYHSSTKVADGAETVAVFGLGPIGLGNVIMQASLGRRVIGIDRAPRRLELARSMGAFDVIDASGKDVVQQLKARTSGRGVCVAIEAAGVPATARLCFAAVKMGGQVIFNGEQSAIELSPSEDFIRRDVSAVGSWFYHFHEYAAMLGLAREGLNVGSLITHRFPFHDAGEAYQAMQAGETGKVLLTYTE
jgi:threonine dehydrogenase-like Zn-dependent dehydrogenase